VAWAPEYITVDELKTYVKVTDDLDDAELALIPGTVSRAIDQVCNRQFGKAASPVERWYRPRWSRSAGRYVVDVDDLMDLTGLPAGLVPGPRNAAADGKPYTRLEYAAGVTPDVDVAFSMMWGWDAVPAAVQVAARLQGSRLATRRDSPYGVAGSPDSGTEIRLLARLDPDVKVSLTAYVRPRWAS
jgi:hypothetical protein